MNEVYYGGVYTTSFGEISIITNRDSLISVDFIHNIINMYKNVTNNQSKLQKNALSNQAARELEEYFSGKRFVFSVPLSPIGTPFCKKVWESLKEIPYAQTRSYKEIALQIGHQKAYRAVGNANNKNPILFFIPCHRVIASNAKLSGYRGGIEIKQRLLELEQKYYNAYLK